MSPVSILRAFSISICDKDVVSKFRRFASINNCVSETEVDKSAISDSVKLILF